MSEFQPLQRVRVREEGGASISRPDPRILGKDGTIQSIQYGRGTPLEEPPTFYHVEFDSVKWMIKVMAISADWLEPRGAHHGGYEANRPT